MIFGINTTRYILTVSNFTRLTAREITHNNFEISLVVFMPNIPTNYAITYTNRSSDGRYIDETTIKEIKATTLLPFR